MWLISAISLATCVDAPWFVPAAVSYRTCSLPHTPYPHTVYLYTHDNFFSHSHKCSWLTQTILHAARPYAFCSSPIRRLNHKLNWRFTAIVCGTRQLHPHKLIGSIIFGPLADSRDNPGTPNDSGSGTRFVSRESSSAGAGRKKKDEEERWMEPG